MKIYFSIFLTLFLLPLLSTSQDSAQQMSEVLIYATKFAERKKNIVQKIDVILQQRIAALNTQNMGDLLAQSGALFVQKSQQGGSSPVIRGFEASRVLLVVDGVRMNNAIYRAGHLQNVITIDQNMLERVEVLYGPGSTIFGSDALGGVVNFRTKRPLLSTDGKMAIGGSAFTRYSFANNEKTAHVDLSLGGRKLAWLQSYTFSDFGDMKMGRNYSGYEGFGLQKEYIAFINGVDSIMKNEDEAVQKFSGYRQWDITQKLLFQPSSHVNHLVQFQLSNSTDVPRYDRLQDRRSGALRFAEWYYGPQKRLMGSYELNLSRLPFFDVLKAIVAYQDIRESRHQRDYRRYDRKDNRIEDLDVWSFTIDAKKNWKAHELTTGIDGQLNDLQSTAYRENILTGARSPLDSRYPNGKNNMNYWGLYAQHLYKFGGGKFVLNDGIRLQLVRLHSTIADNSFFNLPFNEIRINSSAVTGNLGLVYMPSQKLRMQAGISTGFRAPNIDDLARIFESSTSARQLVIPNPDIKPEYTYNADLGATYSDGRFNLELTGFYTLFRNAIALAPFQLNGQDSVLYNGVRSRVFANSNVNRARIYGLQFSAQYSITPQWRVSGSINYTRGRYQVDPSKPSRVFFKRGDGSHIDTLLSVSERPLDHIPPLYGRASVQYWGKRLQAEVYFLFNGWKRVTEMNTDGEDNAQYAPPAGYVPGQLAPDGYPSWYTLNFKLTASVIGRLQLQLGVENILDRNYRPFASGFSAAGRNFIAALRMSL